MHWLIGETVSNSEVWSVASDALDSFLFSEYKPPKVRFPPHLETKNTFQNLILGKGRIHFLSTKVRKPLWIVVLSFIF